MVYIVVLLQQTACGCAGTDCKSCVLLSASASRVRLLLLANECVLGSSEDAEVVYVDERLCCKIGEAGSDL